MIVITLSKTPMSLRGDLTKWCQEIQTGVYVGNVNAKIREQLWQRIEKNIGTGEATLVYNTNNELGYTFKTTRSDRRIIDLDGIPFLKRLKKVSTVNYGFSNAARFRKIKKYQKVNNEHIDNQLMNFVVIDIETTGLIPGKDDIISIGAIKLNNNGKLDTFYKLINIEKKIPDKIYKQTGISSQLLKDKGTTLNLVLKELEKFISNKIIVGYNLAFDISFLEAANRKINRPNFQNTTKDLLPVVKKYKKFLDDYQLNTVLHEYDIINLKSHNSKFDAESTWYLAKKLIDKGSLKV